MNKVSRIHALAKFSLEYEHMTDYVSILKEIYDLSVPHQDLPNTQEEFYIPGFIPGGIHPDVLKGLDSTIQSVNTDTLPVKKVKDAPIEVRAAAKRADEYLLSNKPKISKPKIKGLIPIEIDDKTTIYAKPGEDPEEVKRKFIESLNASRKKFSSIKDNSI